MQSVVRGVAIGVVLLPTTILGDENAGNAAAWPPLEGAVRHLYKTVDETRLHLHAFLPTDWNSADQRAAVVFFFGGGWVRGNPVQFKPQCEYLASRGMVAFTAEYRIKSRHGTTPFECVMDGKSAIRWVRRHAAELGVDPGRIAAGGGSAGGHVAAATAVLSGLEEPGEDVTVSSVPNALILFNPAVDTTRRRSAERIGERARELSVVHRVLRGLPPTIIFHGTDDAAVPIETVRRFRDAMRSEGNRCELVEFEGYGHGFFNHDRDEEACRQTMRRADLFLRSLGYLEGEPTIAP